MPVFHSSFLDRNLFQETCCKFCVDKSFLFIRLIFWSEIHGGSGESDSILRQLSLVLTTMNHILSKINVELIEEKCSHAFNLLFCVEGKDSYQRTISAEDMKVILRVRKVYE